MKLSRRSRLILGCVADVARGRVRLAAALRVLRRSAFPALSFQNVRRWQLWLSRAEEVLTLAFECCVMRDAPGLPLEG